jgi:hypothetical protein
MERFSMADDSLLRAWWKRLRGELKPTTGGADA